MAEQNVPLSVSLPSTTLLPAAYIRHSARARKFRGMIDLFPLFRGDAELIIPIPELLRGRERQRGVEDETAITPFSLPPSLSLFLVIFLPSLA